MENWLCAFTKFFLISLSLVSWEACSISKQIGKTAKQDIINKTDLTSANIGICIYDPIENKFLYNHNSNKYFIPASNTKIITCYAAMKYLGDSLAGLRVLDCQTVLLLIPTGDPTLLHHDFRFQPVIEFLKNQTKPLFFMKAKWQEKALGKGWAWDDFKYDYSAERNAMPVFGNVATVRGDLNNLKIEPSVFSAHFKYNQLKDSIGYIKNLERALSSNEFEAGELSKEEVVSSSPFITSDSLALQILSDTIHKDIKIPEGWIAVPPVVDSFVIKSQPTDSVLKIMMHRSDNFLAEQSLLMVSNEVLGVMNDEKIIDTLVKTIFKEIPQKPRWVDGSGLSRYNLFTPQDFVFILNKMRSGFSWNRITTIFANGGTGTLVDSYKDLEGRIYAKTGTLSNNVALSGYLITNKNKTLIFSVLIGNHMSNAPQIRSDIEKFLMQIIKNH